MKRQLFNAYAFLALVSVNLSASADQIFNTEVLAWGYCGSRAGACTDGESFFPDVLQGSVAYKIKDNRVGIWFDDTTDNHSDWIVFIDDLADQNSVPEAFHILNVENDSIPFIIENGAGSNLLYLDAAERVGINTNVPTETLEISAAQPGLRLDDTSVDAGFADLDVFDNELQIQGNTEQAVIRMDTRAPSNALSIDMSGSVGVGTGDATAKFEVVGSTDAVIKARNTNAVTGTDRYMFQLADPSASKIRFSITNAVGSWSFDSTGSQFQVNKVGTGVNEFRVESNGDIVARGISYATNHVNTSSRAAKTDFEPVDESAVLEKLASLPMETWRYKTEGTGQRHLGPVAEDFQRAFGLSDGRHISTVDADGVALTAIKALYQQLKQQDLDMQQRDQELSQLRLENQALREKLAQDSRQFEERLAGLEKFLMVQKTVAQR